MNANWRCWKWYSPYITLKFFKTTDCFGKYCKHLTKVVAWLVACNRWLQQSVYEYISSSMEWQHQHQRQTHQTRGGSLHQTQSPRQRLWVYRDYPRVLLRRPCVDWLLLLSAVQSNHSACLGHDGGRASAPSLLAVPQGVSACRRPCIWFRP